jgi:hypothetical protein
MSTVQLLRTIGDSLQIVGVLAVVIDIVDVREALGMRTLQRVAGEKAARIGVALQGEVMRVVHVFRKPKPRVLPLEGRAEARTSGSAELTVTYGRAGTDSEMIDKLLRIANDHQAFIDKLQRAIEAEKTERTSTLAGMATELRDAVAKVDELLRRVAGRHHGRRLMFALMIVFGLGLNLWADRLVA